MVNDLSTQRSSLQSGAILGEAQTRLGIRINPEMEQALLTIWHDLFRTGYLAWGYNLANPNPPFCHVTDQGRRTLQHLSRDPANPDGYLEYLSKNSSINPISESYLKEALYTYNNDCFKAAAVMIGAAAESIVLQLRDTLLNRMKSNGKTPPKDLEDWRIKRIMDALKKEFDSKKSDMPTPLFESYQAYWSAFTQQIRAARNEAGHPTSIAPVTHEIVHASLLIFPELARLSTQLESWIISSY